jgi:hypothetical protein
VTGHTATTYFILPVCCQLADWRNFTSPHSHLSAVLWVQKRRGFGIPQKSIGWGFS